MPAKRPCQQHLRPSQKTRNKNKNNETLSSTCGQQCIMMFQEHNRSKQRTWHEKKKRRPRRFHKKKTISVIVDKVHHMVSISIPKIPAIKLRILRFSFIENKRPLSLIISVRKVLLAHLCLVTHFLELHALSELDLMTPPTSSSPSLGWRSTV